MADDHVCSMDKVRFAYQGGSAEQFVLDHLAVAKGETVLLTGESGFGKSTVLGLVCGVLVPDQGSIVVADKTISTLSGNRRDQVRADHIGYIFQRANLLPYLSPLENILLTGQFSRRRRTAAGALVGERKASAEALLDRLGVGSIDRQSSTLSVGQQQRVAAARAFYGRPDLLVADEPTAALDQGNRDKFFALLLDEARRNDAGVLVVSHDTGVTSLFDRHVELGSISRWETS